MEVSEQDVAEETLRLLGFAARSRVPGGFAMLDARGGVVPGAPLELWVTCRMTHVFGLATALEPSYGAAGELLDHGVEALLGPWHDDTHTGWYAALAASGQGPTQDRKDAYAHAFVVLAGATAAGVGHPRGAELLDRAVTVLMDRFVEDAPGMVRDSWDRGFARCDDYRGLNATMHTLEALLAAHDVTGEARLLATARRIGERVAGDLGPAWGWRLPEHFDRDWTPLPDLNRETPEDPFRPYGVTIGHLLEWSRLLLHLQVALDRADLPGVDLPGVDLPGVDLPGVDLLGAAAALGATAVRDGWAVDGRDGFVYTTDFDGVPVVRERLHWVVAEAVAAAWLRVSAGLEGLDSPDGLEDHARWLAFAWEHHRDPAGGSWWHELDPDLRPAGRTWPGKPDVYHALQALWLPRIALVGSPCTSFVGAVVT